MFCYFKSSCLSNSDPLWQRCLLCSAKVSVSCQAPRHSSDQEIGLSRYMKPTVTSPMPPKQTEPLAPQKKQRAQKPVPAQRKQPPTDPALRDPRAKRRAFSSGSGVPELKEENTLLWFQYIAERQRVYNCWFQGAGHPWTKDTTLAHGRMCNNYRFLDRESTWAVANIVEPLRHRPADLLFNILIFRCYLNWHKSMELVGLQATEGFDRATFEARLRNAHAKLGKLSSAAYNVGSFHAFCAADELMQAEDSGVKPTRASVMFAQLAPLMPEVARSIMERRDSMHTFKTLVNLKGVGRFLGWQCCLDLGYWNPAVYNESFHVEVGPGAEEGLSWLFKDTGGLDPIACVKYLATVQTAWFDKAGISPKTRRSLFGSIPCPPSTAGVGPNTAEFAKDLGELTGPLNLMAIEGALCEGNKYFRVHYNDGSGRFKQQYRASTGADARYKADFSVMMRTLASTWGAVVGQSPTPPGTVAVGVRVGKQASALPCLTTGQQKPQSAAPLDVSTTSVKKLKPAISRAGAGAERPRQQHTATKKHIERVGARADGPGRKCDVTGKLVKNPSLLIGKMVECFDGRNRMTCVGRVMELKHVFGVQLAVQLSDGTVVTKRLNKIKQVDVQPLPLADRVAEVKSYVPSTRTALQTLCADLDLEDDDDNWDDNEDEEHSPVRPRHTADSTQVCQTSSGRAVTKPKWLQDDAFVTGADLQEVVKEAERPLACVDEHTKLIKKQNEWLQQFHANKLINHQATRFTSADSPARRGKGREGECSRDGMGSLVEGSSHGHLTNSTAVWTGGTPPSLPVPTRSDGDHALNSNRFWLAEDSSGTGDGASGKAAQGQKRKRKLSAKGSAYATATAKARNGAKSGPDLWSEPDQTLRDDKQNQPAGQKTSLSSVRPVGGRVAAKQEKRPEAKVKMVAAKASTTAGADAFNKQNKGSKTQQSAKRKMKMKGHGPGQKRSCSGPLTKRVSSKSPPELPAGYVLLEDDQFVVEDVLSKRESPRGSGQYEYLLRQLILLTSDLEFCTGILYCFGCSSRLSFRGAGIWSRGRGTARRRIPGSRAKTWRATSA